MGGRVRLRLVAVDGRSRAESALTAAKKPAISADIIISTSSVVMQHDARFVRIR